MITIGGSEVASAIGQNKFCPPIELWRQKVEGYRRPATPATRWGTLLEPVVREHYATEHSATVIVPGEPLYGPGGRAWMRASPDGIVLMQPSGDWHRGLEIKTAGHWMASGWGEPGSDEIPVPYLLQCQWYLEVTGLRRWDVAVLIGGQRYAEYVVHYDRELMDLVVPRVEEFLGYCERKEPPPPDGSEEYAKYLADVYPHTRDDLVDGSDADTRAAAEVLRDARATMAAAKERKAWAEALLKARIGEHAGIETPLGKITWRQAKGRTVVDWQRMAEDLAGSRLDGLKDKYTRTTKGSRRFIVPRSWSKE